MKMDMSQHCTLVAVKAECIMGGCPRKSLAVRSSVCFYLPPYPNTGEMFTDAEDIAKTC